MISRLLPKFPKFPKSFVCLVGIIYRRFLNLVQASLSKLSFYDIIIVLSIYLFACFLFCKLLYHSYLVYNNILVLWKLIIIMFIYIYIFLRYHNRIMILVYDNCLY